MALTVRQNAPRLLVCFAGCSAGGSELARWTLGVPGPRSSRRSVAEPDRWSSGESSSEEDTVAVRDRACSNRSSTGFFMVARILKNSLNEWSFERTTLTYLRMSPVCTMGEMQDSVALDTYGMPSFSDSRKITPSTPRSQRISYSFSSSSGSFSRTLSAHDGPLLRRAAPPGVFEWLGPWWEDDEDDEEEDGVEVGGGGVCEPLLLALALALLLPPPMPALAARFERLVKFFRDIFFMAPVPSRAQWGVAGWRRKQQAACRFRRRAASEGERRTRARESAWGSEPQPHHRRAQWTDADGCNERLPGGLTHLGEQERILAAGNGDPARRTHPP